MLITCTNSLRPIKAKTLISLEILQQLCTNNLHHGQVQFFLNFFVFPDSCQAFLEMNSEEAAQNLVGYYSTVVPIIRHHPVYVQFSNHKELKTDNSPNQEVAYTAVNACTAPSLSWHLVDPSSLSAFSEGPSGSSGPQYISCGHGGGSSKHSPESGGGEPHLSCYPGCLVPGIHNTPQQCACMYMLLL